MKSSILVTGILLVTGCASGPRPFDGVLGYRTESLPAGLQVTYIDEAKTSPERTFAQITKVCGAKLGLASSAAQVKILSETPFEQQVNMSVAIPVGISVKSGYGPGAIVGIKNSVTQAEEIIRTMKFKKVMALCSAAP